jgi:hypothetical protein
LARRVPTTQVQTAAPGSGSARVRDPLVRFMEAIRL